MDQVATDRVAQSENSIMSHEWNCHVFEPVQPKSRAEIDQLKKSEWAATATVTCTGNGRLYTAEITYGASGHITVEWDPCTPNQLAQQVADYIGAAVLMVD